MSYQEYVAHYFEMPYFAVFTVIAAVLLLCTYLVFFVFAKKTTENTVAFSHKFFSLSERFYELIFSGGAIIGFMSIYWLIDRFVTSGDFYNFWSEYKDYLLLIFMIISIVLNTIYDHLIVRLKHLDREDMASIRLTGMLYMILILCYLKYVYESTNYDTFIAYFITVMIGRFVYFDASFKDFLNCIKSAAKNIPIMIMALIYLALMCEYGYTQEYLLKHNGVITNIFITHIVISVVIAVMQWVPGVIIKKYIRKDKDDMIREGKNHPNNDADYNHARRNADSNHKKSSRARVKNGERATQADDRLPRRPAGRVDGRAARPEGRPVRRPANRVDDGGARVFSPRMDYEYDDLPEIDLDIEDL